MIQKVAVTGASGMLGRHVVQCAANQGIGCVVSSRNRPESLPELAAWRSWDLCSWLEADALDALFGDVDALIHVGAITPRKNIAMAYRDVFDANVRACLCLGKWAIHKNLPVVYISSATSYADPESPQIMENAALAHRGGKLGGFYGFSKLIGEEVLARLAAEGLRLCVFRPSSIYGTGLSDDQMMSVFLNRALEGKDIVIHSHPESRVNVVYAADVATAIFTALQRGVVGTFNIAAPEMFTILQIARTVLSVCGDKREAAIQLEETSSIPFIRFDLNCSAAERAFGFKPRITLEEGLNLMKDGLIGAPGRRGTINK